MARPKENPEQHITSPEAARARFLQRNPTLEDLVANGRRIPAGDAFLRWLSGMAAWMRALGERIADAPEMPPLPPNARELAQTLGGMAADWVVQYDAARMLLDKSRVMGASQPPDLTPEFRDRRMLLAVIAVEQVERDGGRLTPLDLVLLEVATGVSDRTPTPDESEYVRRQEAAGKRLNRAREWVESRRRPISPEPGSAKPLA